MPKRKTTSPARSQGGPNTPKRKITRGSRSLCSPALSTASGRLTSLIDQFKDKNMDSFALSPLTGRSVLNDNTEIEEPRRKSWWKKLDENSQDVIEVLEDNMLTINNEFIDIEVLSQEKKNYTLDLPESSDNESINSIVLPQRRLFTQKENQPQKKYGHLIDNRESLAKLHKTNTENIDKTINVGTRELFQNAKRSKPIFPASLLNISSNKTATDKTGENVLADPKPQVRNIFGNRPANKRKNMFADFIVSESEDEIPEIQPKVFGFQKKLEQRRISSISKGRDASPALSITTDIEMDFKMLLPSSTMVENQLEDNIMSEENTPVKRARLSKLSELKESEAGTLQSITSDRTKQSNKSIASKNKSQATPELKDKSLNSSRITRSMLKNASKPDEQTSTTSDKTKQTNKSVAVASKNLSKGSPELNDISLNSSSATSNMLKNASNHGEQTNTTSDKTEHSNNSVASKNKSKASPELKDKSLNSSRTTSKANEEGMNESQEEAVNERQEVQNEVSQGEDEEEASESDENVADAIVSEVIEGQENEKEANESQEIEVDINASQKIDQETNESQQIEEEANEIQEVVDAHASDEENVEGMDEDEKETVNESQVHENESQDVENGKEESHEVVNKSQKDVEETNDSQEVEKEANKSQEVVDAHSSDEENDERMDEDEEETANESEVHKNESKVVENDKEVSHEIVNESQKVEEETSKEIEEEANESQEIEAEANESQEDEEANESQEIEAEANESQDDEEEGNESQEDEERANESQDIEEEANESQEIDNEAYESQEVVDAPVSDEENDEEMDEAEEESGNESQVHENESKEVENDEEESHEVASEAESEEVDDQQMDDSDEADKAIASDPEISDDNQADEMEVDDEESEQESDNESKQNESHEERQVEEQNEIEPSEEIEESPNVTHDTTGRHRKKDLNKSPEVILHDKTNQNDSFTAKGRNTSVRKTKSMIKNLNITPSLAPSRDSIGFSDGTTNSSTERSGWDSHRTTRKTLRQTFGKDFTPRKSLRALVMEKSAKRQKEHLEMHSETVKFPLANSTEMPEDSNHYVEDIVESDHEASRRTRQTTLEMYLQKMKEQNIEKRLKMEAAVRNSLKNPIKDSLSLFKVPNKPAPRRPKPTQSKAKKPLKSIICIDDLPSDVIEDMKYKPPKRYQPPNASWITKRLYKYLENKLEAKYDYKARVRAEKLVETIYLFVKDLRRHEVAPPDAVDVLKHELARLEVVRTHFEFYEFFYEFMPREVRIKVVPDIVNKISPPRHGPFSDILRNGNTT